MADNKILIKEVNKTEISMENHKLINVIDPFASQDVATKGYVDTLYSDIKEHVDGSLHISSSTSEIRLTDSATESISGTATNQQDVNKEFVTKIQETTNSVGTAGINLDIGVGVIMPSDSNTVPPGNYGTWSLLETTGSIGSKVVYYWKRTA